MRGFAQRHNWRAMSALPPTADIGTRCEMSALCQKRTSALHSITSSARLTSVGGNRTHKMGGRHCRKCLRSTAALLEVTFSYFQDHLYDLLIRLHHARNLRVLCCRGICARGVVDFRSGTMRNSHRPISCWSF